MVKLPRELAETMRATVHTDPHHHGESVLEHTMEVLQDVGVMYPDDNPSSDLMKTVAAWHDTGKPATARIEKGRTMFVGHAAESERLAKEAGLSEEACALVGQHHDLIHLMNNAKNELDRPIAELADSKVARMGLIDQLIAFAFIDARRNLDFEETARKLVPIVERVRMACSKTGLKRARAARIEEGKTLRLQQARDFLIERGYPEAAAVLPDFPAARAILGETKKKEAWQTIRDLDDVLAGE